MRGVRFGRPETEILSSLVLLGGLLGSPVPSAQAQFRPSLQWVRLEGAEQCVGVRQLIDAVEARVGRSVFFPPADADVLVEGHVTPTASGWAATLKVLNSDSELLGLRQLAREGDDCHVLDESLALVLAALVAPDELFQVEPLDSDAEKAAEPDHEDTSGTGARQAAESAAPSAGTTPSPTSASRNGAEAPAAGRSDRQEQGPTWGVEGGLLGSTALGILPGLALGGGVRIAVHPPGLWPIEVSGAAFRANRREASNASGADLSVVHGSLELCPRTAAGLEAVDLSLCGGVQVGLVRSRGFGFERSFDADEPAVHVIAGLQALWHLVPGLAAQAGVHVGVPLIRHRFEAVDPGGDTFSIYEMSVVQVGATLGLRVIFSRKGASP